MLDAVRRCNASLFTDRAISYRIDKGFDHFQVALSACVQKMVRSDLAASGVIFSIDTETGFKDAVFITGAFGLGENVVQGAVDPDEFYVHKPTYRQGHRAVLRRVLGAKKVKMVYAEGRTREATLNKPTSKEEREHFCLTDPQVLTLADYALKIEDHYGKRSGHFTPMDIEWALDGLDDELYIVQARPETVASQRQATVLEEYHVTGERQGAGRGPRGRHQMRRGSRPDRQGRPPSVRVPPGRGAGRGHHDARLGAGDEDRGRDRHQPRRAHLPCRDRRPRARHPGGGRHRPRHPRARRPAPRSRSPAPRATSAGSTRARCPIRSRPPICARSRSPRPTSWSTSATPSSPSRPASSRTTASASRGSSSSSTSTSRRTRLALLHPDRVEDEAERARILEMIRTYPSGRRVLHRAAVGGRRHDRRGVLAQARDRAAVGLQDQRVRGADRRARVRAARGEPDDRLPRRLALRASRLPGGLRARVRGDAPGARPTWGSRTSRS